MDPIILAHGFIGYRKFMVWSMYKGVVDALQKRGYHAVQPMVHPTATIEERSLQLVDYINRELGDTSCFHWIGHSMGGLDGRYIASPGGLNQGHRFRSLTTLSSPHHGSSLARQIPRWARKAVSRIARVGKYLFKGEQKQFLNHIAEYNWNGLEQLSPEYMEKEFNPRIVDHPDVKYYSYAGVVNFQKVHFNNIPRQPTWRFMRSLEGDNDGMVSVESARWGEFKGTVPCDHGGLVGLRFIPWTEQSFDYVQFIVKIVEELDLDAP